MRGANLDQPRLARPRACLPRDTAIRRPREAPVPAAMHRTGDRRATPRRPVLADRPPRQPASGTDTRRAEGTRSRAGIALAPDSRFPDRPIPQGRWRTCRARRTRSGQPRAPGPPPPRRQRPLPTPPAAMAAPARPRPGGPTAPPGAAGPSLGLRHWASVTGPRRQDRRPAPPASRPAGRGSPRGPSVRTAPARRPQGARPPPPATPAPRCSRETPTAPSG